MNSPLRFILLFAFITANLIAFSQPVTCHFSAESSSDFKKILCGNGIRNTPIEELEIINIPVVYHFMNPDSTQFPDIQFHCDPSIPNNFYVRTLVREILENGNDLWSAPAQNYFGISGPPDKVADAKIRYYLPDEDDPCGKSIKVYPFGTPHDLFDEKVLNIVVRQKDTVDKHFGGSASIGLGRISLYNMDRAIQNKHYIAWIQNHELGHVFGLKHSFDCDNRIEDMDVGEECGTPDSTNCDPPPISTLCSSSGLFEPCQCSRSGNNIMGYNYWSNPKAERGGLTPRQVQKNAHFCAKWNFCSL